MSIAKETAERDELLKLAANTIQKINKKVEDVGKNMNNSTNPFLHRESLKKLYENFCSKGDCSDIDNVNNLIQYLEDSYNTTNDPNVKQRIKIALNQVKQTLNIKY